MSAAILPSSGDAAPSPAGVPAPAAPRYTLPPARDDNRGLARGWLMLGLAALLGSGLFSVLLVLARTPAINARLPGVDFFRVALVVHVDLSVLVWFVATAGLLWSLVLRPARTGAARVFGVSPLVLCALGALGMALTPFLAPGAPVMANYIPMLDSRLFQGALWVFAAGGLLLVLLALLRANRAPALPAGSRALGIGLEAAAVAGVIALLAFAWSLAKVPLELPAEAYYEILYWGGGHALQYVWTLLMLVAWLVLAEAAGGRIPFGPRAAVGLFVLALLGVFATPAAYLLHDVSSVEFRALNTLAMQYGGGVAVAPVALAAILALRVRHAPATPGERPLRAALLASILLFGAGGVIGLFIHGSNVRIPAHYHGCIVGVTLALMGLIYRLLPELGYAEPRGRLAVVQPWLYGGGQLLHITGLMWSGGYGVQRKVAGAEQVLRSTGEVAGMGLMGLGGLLAIIGGLLFAVVVIGAMRRPPAQDRNEAEKQ